MLSFSFSSSFLFPTFFCQNILFVCNHKGLLNMVSLLYFITRTHAVNSQHAPIFKNNVMLSLEIVVNNTFFIHHSPCEQYFGQYVFRQAEINKTCFTHLVPALCQAQMFFSELLNNKFLCCSSAMSLKVSTLQAGQLQMLRITKLYSY